MDVDFSFIFTLPAAYWVALSTLIGLLAEAGLRYREKWSAPAAMVYLTIFGWYVFEPIYAPDTMEIFSDQAIGDAFVSVFVFLLAFRGFLGVFVSAFAPAVARELRFGGLPANRMLLIAATVWLVLLAFGTWRMEFDLFATLFPVQGRAGVSMWQRAAGVDAGRSGFIVAIASYLYILVLALFGMLLPLVRGRRMFVLCLSLIVISWPYAFLQGSRNITLAVFIPMIFSMVLFTRLNVIAKGSIAFIAAIFINWAMILIINFRNYGFDAEVNVESERHLGLNMGSELIYAVSFIRDGILEKTWGYGLLAEVANIVPRAIWPDKPLLRMDFAVARGFGGADNDIGLVATISSGLIGQGVLEFGQLLGPVLMAALIAIWAAWLARLWSQGTVPRVCLFLVGMGITFNLGRNLTLLVLWPMVFAYVMVLAYERFGKRPVQRRLPAPQVARAF